MALEYKQLTSNGESFGTNRLEILYSQQIESILDYRNQLRKHLQLQSKLSKTKTHNRYCIGGTI